MPPMAVSEAGTDAVGDATDEADELCDALGTTDTLTVGTESAEGVARDVELPDGDGVADELVLGAGSDAAGVALTMSELLTERLAVTGAVPGAE